MATQVIINDILPLTQIIAIGGQTVFTSNPPWTANYTTDVVVYQTPFGDAPDDVTQILPTSAYSVAFIGDENTVQVTLVTGANAGDVITLTRMTPADRLNLYSNTNFTPTMLNQDFGILTLVDQQSQLVNQQVAPRYNYSQILSIPTDTILPYLPANCVWIKNNANTAIIAYLLPSGGLAPADETFIVQTPDVDNLPNAQALSTLGYGLLYNTTGTGVLSVIAQNSAAPGDVLTFVSATQQPIWQTGQGGGGITNWQTITASSIAVEGGDGIVANRSATPVNVELPATFDVGDEVAIMGLGAGGWTMVANAGQTIHFGSVATSTAGSISSDITNANIFVRGLVANTTWTVVSVNSNPTYL